MRTPAMVIVCALISGCAQHYYPGDYTRIHGPEPTATDIAQARDRMMKCFWKSALELDDQSSDASTIGKTVAGVCSGESGEYARQRLWAKTSQQRADFYSGWDQLCTEIATAAVLQQRRDRLKN